ncbi:hypothetical protein V6N13_086241 [Hibiscus sabdariffa]
MNMSCEKTWTYTRTDLETVVKYDAIFFKGKAYAVDWRLGIISIDVANTDNGSFEEKMVIPPKHDEEASVALKYIVESSDGEILIVERLYGTSEAEDGSLHHWTVYFKVLKVERHANDEARLVEINNIGDEALFLGDNSSISVVASRFPGCRSNCIYFTDDIILFAQPYRASGPIDMGIFSLETDWTKLPKNVVVLIVEKLVFPLSQFVWFGLVCKDWHTTIVDHHLLRRQVLKGCHRQVPLLMIPTKDKSRETRGLYNIIHKKIHHSELSVPNSRRCCGSSYGWIATVDQTSAVKLINPFTDGIIDLPSVANFTAEENEYECYVKKVILSADPYVNPDNFMILALFGRWVQSPSSDRGKAYAVDWRLGIVSVDVANTDSSSFKEKMHLEAEDGSLLHWTVNFKVFKVERHANDEARLVEINNIGDEALFLGNNSSISVVASRFPGYGSNCIYFTDDTVHFAYPFLTCDEIDMGIFNLETGCIERYNVHDPSNFDMPPSFFILPTLGENRGSPYLHL